MFREREVRNVLGVRVSQKMEKCRVLETWFYFLFEIKITNPYNCAWVILKIA